MPNPIQIMDSSKNCAFCGSPLRENLLCTKIQCVSYRFSVGNRIIVPSRRDYGFGYIEDILDFKTPYEYCADIDHLDKKELQEEPVRNAKVTAKDNSLIFEKPMYQIKFKIYISKNLPAEELRHDIFEKGKRVRTKLGLGTIENININEKNVSISYDVLFDDNTRKNLKENEIIEYIFNPIESLMQLSYNDPVSFVLNLFGKAIHNTYTSNTIKFVTNSRLSLLPHQVFIAHELIMKYMPRYILADEVGLGKTIEAGIFLKEMISRDLAKKILIIVPANLVDQWIFEFENKFSIHLEKFDTKFVKYLDRCSHPNVFFRIDTGKECPYIITSLQFARFARIRSILTTIYWDYVIFDEAHHLRRYLSTANKFRETLAYRLAKKLSEKTSSLLLLTATPIQLHSFDLFSLLQLIRPDIFRNYDDFEEERKRIPILNMLIRSVNNFRELNHFQRVNTIELIESFLARPSLINKAISAFYNRITQNIDTADSQNKDTTHDLRENINSQYVSHIQKLIEENFIDPNNAKLYNYETIEKLVQSEAGRKKLINKLQEYHFLSAFMFRNRKRTVYADKFNERIVRSIPVKQTEEEKNLYEQIRLYLARTYNDALEENNNALGFIMVILQKLATSSPPALISSLEKRVDKLKQEIEGREGESKPDFYDDEFEIDEDDWDEWTEIGAFAVDRSEQSKQKHQQKITNQKHLQILEDFLNRLKKLTIDSKLEELKKLIKEINKNTKKKIIIFTQFMKTVFYLQNELINIGCVVDVFHGSLTNEQKNQAVDRFKQEVEILISTEAGGEGRNFQFCNIIINYDLPWNPMKLEQRIGRLDRIGQKKDIYIYNFTTLGTIEHRILDILTQRIQLFEESIGNLEPIVAKIEKSINKAIFSEDNIINTVDTFKTEIEKSQNKIEEIEAQLDDFILDKKSFQLDRVNKIIQDSPNIISEVDLLKFTELFFKKYIYNNEIAGDLVLNKLKNGTPFYEIKISDSFKKTLKLEQSVYRGVFDLDLAQNEESLNFIALGHPLITKLSEYCKEENLGNPSAILKMDFNRILKLPDILIAPKEKEILRQFFEHKIDLWMFIFELEFNGIIIEKIIRPIIITNSGTILENISNFLIRPHNFMSVLQLNWEYDHVYLNQELKKIDLKQIEDLLQKAKEFFKNKIESSRSNISELNENMFKKELQRLLSLYEYKKEYILLKMNHNKASIEKLQSKAPTKRQWENLEKMDDKDKRKEKEDKYNLQLKMIQNANLELEDLKKQLEALEFDLPEDIKRLEFYRKLTKRIWLSQVAFLI